MENVVAFNTELSGLYDTKPPISKAKMAAITKAAMRAIKFYKHVVQSVEKFILKCKSEYKVPGLYVIDSIVRQSRHQFGVEKDVFAPRFARNMKDTFANLFRCAPEDKSRIIRVLNLWQKNNVFAPEVIQPLFDLADPSHPIYQIQSQQSGGSGAADTSLSSNGLNTSGIGMDVSIGSNSGGATVPSNHMGGDDKLLMPDLSNNNLKQLLKDPNVLRQLQTLQNFQKFKQQEEKQHKLNELRMQEEAFEKHIQNVLKGTTGGDAVEMSGKEVEFVSEESKIEVINLDGNDSRSPTPDRDRYKRRRSRSRSRSRSRDRLGIRERRRRSRSRSRSRSPRTNRRRTSRERERERERLAERNRDKEKEKEREHERERRRKGLPDMKKDHLSVCSTTLWVGHLSKLVYQEELSDTFGKYGDIVSIDQIVPRGCAFIVMNRRQDASKAMTSLKNHKLQGRAITISWAAGKGVKSKEWKDFWDLELGVTYIPWDKLEENTDLDALEEGGMFDEDSMPEWMKEKINKLKNIKENVAGGSGGSGIIYGIEGMPKIDTTQPPPQTGGMMPIGPFSIAPPLSAPPRLMPPMGVPMPSSMVPGIPMPPGMVAGMPPPHTMMMPPGMLPPPGYPPIPQLDKNIPPPNMRNDVQNISGMPPSPFVANPGLMQPLPIPTPHPFQQPPNAGGNASSDDQMDIEMEDDISTDTPSHNIPQINFNQPPPMFNSGFSEGIPATGENIGEDFISRDRNRSSNSRWGAREDRDQNRDRGNRSEVHDNIDRDIWRESGSNIQTIGPPAFNDNARRGGGQPINIQPFEISNHAQRSDFFDMRHGGVNDDFNDRRGGGVTRGGGGDFFPNMQNRFNQPNSLMQMRIQPPPVFNNRMGGPGMGPGPGMFMRSQGPRPQGGPSGGGFNFNDRQPFERDIEGNRMRGGRGMNDRRGGGRGGGIRGSLNNWRDNDDEEEGNVFKRRGGGNRFGGGRDRDNLEDNRMSRDRDRLTGGRRQMNDRNSRDRLDRSSRERREGGNDRPLRNRKLSNEQREEPTISPKQVTSSTEIAQPVNANIPLDTEEDWDQELSEHNFEIEKKSISSPQQQVTEQESISEFSERNVPSPFHDNEEKEFVTPLALPRDDVQNEKERTSSINTPLYDEPNANIESKTSFSDKESFAFSESNIENISSEESVPAVAEEISEE